MASHQFPELLRAALSRSTRSERTRESERESVRTCVSVTDLASLFQEVLDKIDSRDRALCADFAGPWHPRPLVSAAFLAHSTASFLTTKKMAAYPVWRSLHRLIKIRGFQWLPPVAISFLPAGIENCKHKRQLGYFTWMKELWQHRRYKSNSIRSTSCSCHSCLMKCKEGGNKMHQMLSHSLYHNIK